MKVRKGRIKKLLELAKKDPKAILQALEAKTRLTAGEFVVLEEARQRLAAKTCRYCGRVFLPKRKTQNFCAPACRVAFYARRSALWHRIRKLRTKYRAMNDEQFRNRWMSRINELRAKEGRPPYWNTHENRPYTKDEVALLQRPATTSFEPVSQFRRHNEFRRHSETRLALHRSEQPNKASDKRFLTFQAVLFGREYTVKIPFNPTARCSHKNWRTGNIGWRNEPALICLDCGAIYLVNEGVWRYIPDATGRIDW
jgi:hypothetical protein